MKFKTFVEQNDKKTWSAGKQEIIDHWKGLRSDLPLLMKPMPPPQVGRKRKSFGQDNIRITGGAPFINFCLSRLKEIINYENPKTKLRLVYKEIDPYRRPDPTRKSFAFYVTLDERAHKAKKLKTPKPQG